MTRSGNDQIIQTQNLSSFLQRTQPLLWYPLVPRPPLLLWAADLTVICLPRGSHLDTQHWVCFQPYRLLLGYLQPQCQCLLVLYPEIKIKSGKHGEEREDKPLLFFTRLPYTTNPGTALPHSQGAFTNSTGLRTAHHLTREKTCQSQNLKISPVTHASYRARHPKGLPSRGLDI